MTLSAGLDSVSASGEVTMNSKYKAFEEDQMGLKEAIELLLDQDQDTMRGIEYIATQIDDYLDQVVNEGFKGDDDGSDD